MNKIDSMTEKQLSDILVSRRKARAWIMIVAGIVGLVGAALSPNDSISRVIFVLLLICGVPGIFMLLNSNR